MDAYAHDECCAMRMSSAALQKILLKYCLHWVVLPVFYDDHEIDLIVKYTKGGFWEAVVLMRPRLKAIQNRHGPKSY